MTPEALTASLKAKSISLINRLEALSPREQAMVVLGIPLALLVAAELLVFDPAGKQAAAARKQAEQKQVELKALSGVLAATPAVAPLPAADQLLKQRNELQAQIDQAGSILDQVKQTTDWGSVVRAAVAGTPGLTLTQLKTVPAELVFSPGQVKLAAAAAAKPATGASAAAATAAAAAASAAVALAAQGESVYRHRADLMVKGDFASLLGYLQTLQKSPGDLRWDKLALSVAAYPQASMQLNLYTLSNRAETPFN